jgi:2-polyprenyl-3-methyl-5-hydroxy-6-metoxy-1,4-benzoquinol methylase
MSSGASAAVSHYDSAPDLFGARYSSGRFEDIHRNLLRYLPRTGAAVLDVGAGIGRDAAALARRGYAVTAIEPSLELQRWGREHYNIGGIRWFADYLPKLASLDAEVGAFEFILCSAVLIHLAPDQIDDSFRTLARLLRPGGRLGVSVRHAIASDLPGVFFDHDDEALIAAAKKAQLEIIDKAQSEDALGRSEVKWRSLVLEQPVAPAHD